MNRPSKKGIFCPWVFKNEKKNSKKMACFSRTTRLSFILILVKNAHKKMRWIFLLLYLKIKTWMNRKKVNGFVIKMRLLRSYVRAVIFFLFVGEEIKACVTIKKCLIKNQWRILTIVEQHCFWFQSLKKTLTIYIEIQVDLVIRVPLFRITFTEFADKKTHID